MIRLRNLVVITAMLLVAVSAFAQITASLTGTVTSEGAPLSPATRAATTSAVSRPANTGSSLSSPECRA